MTSGTEASPLEQWGRPTSTTWGIFLISVLGLFLEMLLIRWVGTEVRVFAYLQNTILVVCFLGIGLGCFTSRRPIDLRASLIPLAGIALLFAIPFTRAGAGRISVLLSATGDLLMWNAGVDIGLGVRVVHVALGLAAVYALSIFILDIFVPIGRILGRLLDTHTRPIAAYSANIAGSLVGTWLFVILSALYQPPVVWFLAAALLSLFFLPGAGRARTTSLALLGAIVVLAWCAGHVPGAIRVVWSPYQKLVLRESDPTGGEVGDYMVTVNNAGYQAMLDPSRPVESDPRRFPVELVGLSQYDIPPLLHPQPETMLVVGAGSGNDAAGGLRHGVKRLTAVEIDPAIIEMGRSHHPTRPYDSPGVEVVLDDARSYFATTNRTFDVVAFGLLDSHTTTAMTNARLDHYVYTRESLTRARELLAPGGIMVLSFEVEKPFVADRMSRALEEVFGEKPLAFRIPFSGYGWGGVMFVSGDLVAARAQIEANPKLSSLIATLQKRYPLEMPGVADVATDDWPYIYLETPSIPSLYFLLAVLLALVFRRSARRWEATGIASRWSVEHWHFFCLGAAFMLLEVQNISKASVVLGNTWQVNAIIVSGVLSMALLANLVAERFPRLPLAVAYTGLIATCLSLYFVDLARFAFLPYASKSFVVGGLTTLPMFFSGIVFVRSFAVAPRKDEALGANMAGALVGALLQSVTFVTGIKALLLIVAGLYTLALLSRPGQRSRRVARTA